MDMRADGFAPNSERSASSCRSSTTNQSRPRLRLWFVACSAFVAAALLVPLLSTIVGAQPEEPIVSDPPMPQIAEPAAMPETAPIVPQIAVPAVVPEPAPPAVIRLDLGTGEARYRAREVLVGVGLPSEAVGSTRDVTGAIVVDSSGAVLAGSRIVVNLRSLRSNERNRDQFIQQSTLQTNVFPTAEFVPRELRGLSSPIPLSGQVRFQLVGDLTVHGVSRPSVWEANVSINGQDLSGTATTQVRITEFQMQIPRAGPVLSVEDGVTIEVDLRGRLAS